MSTSGPSSCGSSDGAPRSILIVDDDADVLELLEFTFRAAGEWTVRTASSIDSASTVLRGVDVVLLDHHITGSSMADLLEVATRRPVVLLSTMLDAPPSTLVAVAGFAGGISKPFNPLTTPGLVAEALDRLGPAPASADGTSPGRATIERSPGGNAGVGLRAPAMD